MILLWNLAYSKFLFSQPRKMIIEQPDVYSKSFINSLIKPINFVGFPHPQRPWYSFYVSINLKPQHPTAYAPNYFFKLRRVSTKVSCAPPPHPNNYWVTNVPPPPQKKTLKVAPWSLGHPPAFEILKSLLLKFPAPGIRLLVKCLAMWNDFCSNVPAPGTRKIGFCWLIQLLFFWLTRQFF